MNDFEFQRFLPVGQYLETGSILHRIDPRVMLVAMGVFILCVTFSPSMVGLGIGLGFILISYVVARIPLKYVYQNLLVSLPLVLVIAVLTLLINTQPDSETIYFHFWVITLSSSDFMVSALLLLRFVVLILGLSLLSYIMTTAQMLNGLESLLSPLTVIGLPTNDLAVMIQVTVRFLPLLALTGERIAKAQASRGAEWRGKKKGLRENVRRIYPLILPLFMLSLQKAENMALAMDARGYGISPRRTSLVTLHVKTADILFLLIVIGVSGWIVLAG
jgi:energy-coupling factor transport system permease protein